MAKILILGCSGFIGKALTKELSKTNKVVGFDRYISDELLDLDNVKLVTGDFTKYEYFDSLLDGIDVVVHLICTTIPKDDTKNITEEIVENLIPTINLMESMVRCNIREIIFASSAGTVYGETGETINTYNSPLNPICSYGVLKQIMENYINFYNLRYGINHKIMRITNPYGWGQDKNKGQGLIPILVNKIKMQEEVFIWGDGKNLRDYVFMDDVVKAVSKIISYKGSRHIFNIGYGKYYNIFDVIEKIQRESGKVFKNIRCVEARFCDVKKSYVDLSESQKELEWYPCVDLDTGIKLTIENLIND